MGAEKDTGAVGISGRRADMPARRRSAEYYAVSAKLLSNRTVVEVRSTTDSLEEAAARLVNRALASATNAREVRIDMAKTGKKVTGKKAASAASRVVRDGRTSKKSKSAAGSALSQREKAKRKKK